MNKLLKTLLFVLPVVFFFTACGPDEELDTQRPEISVISPADDSNFLSGDTIHFEANFTDNIALSQYKIEIHENFDGHQHGKNAVPFYHSFIGNLSGTQQHVSRKIPIPENSMSGEYHMIINATDAAGNEAHFIELELHIINRTDQNPPQITITSLQASAGNNFSQGTPIVIAGTITDDQALKEIEILLFNEQNQKVFDKDIDVSGTSYSLNETIPTTSLAKGRYHLEVIAIDHVNNRTEVEFEIDIE